MYSNKLFFAMVDFDEGSDVFQMVSKLLLMLENWVALTAQVVHFVDVKSHLKQGSWKYNLGLFVNPTNLFNNFLAYLNT